MKWYFTFGFGQVHEGRYHVIEGSYKDARERMVEKFGKKWAFQYSEEQWTRNGNTQAEEYGYKIIN